MSGLHCVNFGGRINEVSQLSSRHGSCEVAFAVKSIKKNLVANFHPAEDRVSVREFSHLPWRAGRTPHERRESRKHDRSELPVRFLGGNDQWGSGPVGVEKKTVPAPDSSTSGRPAVRAALHPAQLSPRAKMAKKFSRE